MASPHLESWEDFLAVNPKDHSKRLKQKKLWVIILILSKFFEYGNAYYKFLIGIQPFLILIRKQSS